MQLRPLGDTGLSISEYGFGAWAIGGKAYGAVREEESLSALARAESLGCNFVDSALVYGDSEAVLGRFLRERRSRWIVATKYSGQKPSMTATLEQQLKLLGTDYVDLYQIHWCPKDEALYEELAELRHAGKIRFAGVSLYSSRDIDFIQQRADIDAFQVPFSLLQPDPFLARCRSLDGRQGVIVRSSLREGFLTGKFTRASIFPDPNDQRHKWPAEQIARVVDQVERFRFLELEAGSMTAAAARYPLSFPTVSSVLLGTKSEAQAELNFGSLSGEPLSSGSLDRIHRLQVRLGLRGPLWRRVLRRAGVVG